MIEASRQVFRATARTLAKALGKRGLEAGGGGRRWQGAAMLHAPHAAQLQARAPAKARGAGLYVNSPWGAKIVETLAAELVGKGWQARSQHLDRGRARLLNDAFEDMVNPHLLGLARALVRDGEAVFRLIADEEGRLELRQLPADQLDPSVNRELPNGGRIIAGVEFDAAERIVAYWLLPVPPDTPFATWGDAVRVPAEDVLHVFDRQFPGQVRGVSWMAPAMLRIRDRDEAGDALLVQLKVAAQLTGFVRDPEGGTAGFGDGPGEAINVSLEPGAMRVLPPGADVTFSSPPAGPAQALEFLKLQDREIAAAVGLPAFMLDGDMTQVNYSSARTALIPHRRRIEMLQKVLIEGQFLKPLWRRWCDMQILAGELEGTPDARAVRLVAPGWSWVDPQKEVAAEREAVEAGFKSRSEVIAGRGRDPDEVAEEIAAERQEVPQ